MAGKSVWCSNDVQCPAFRSKALHYSPGLLNCTQQPDPGSGSAGGEVAAGGRTNQAAAASGQSQGGGEAGKLGRRAAEQAAAGAREGLIPANRMLEGAGRSFLVNLKLQQLTCVGGCLCGIAHLHRQPVRNSHVPGSLFHTSPAQRPQAQQFPCTACCAIWPPPGLVKTLSQPGQSG